MELNARAAGPTHQEITARSPRDAPEVLGLAGARQKWGRPDIPARPESQTPRGIHSGPTTKDVPFLSSAYWHHHGRFGPVRRQQREPDAVSLHSYVGGSYAGCQGTRGPVRTRNRPVAPCSQVNGRCFLYTRSQHPSAHCSPQTTALTNAAKNSLGTSPVQFH